MSAAGTAALERFRDAAQELDDVLTAEEGYDAPWAQTARVVVENADITLRRRAGAEVRHLHVVRQGR